MQVKISEFAGALEGLLDDYRADVQEAMNRAVDETAPLVMKTVRKNSPHRKGSKYKRSWRKQTEWTGVGRRNKKVTIYNAANPHRTHLLEHGHQKPGGGRVGGIPHIEPAEEEAQRLLPELAERYIEEAGGR